MTQYNCLIVEDEPLAAEVLQDYVQQVPFLSLKGICPDAIFAMEMLQREKIDLIFLDIHLPKLKGFDFIRTLTRHNPYIIITTAYHEYALQGYEYNVIDYLLKPVEFSRFLMAVNKLNQFSPARQEVIAASPADERKYLFFNAGKKKVKIFLDEIIYIESLKEYIRLVTPSKSILTKMPLGQIEETLSAHQFIRIHRSFIVAKNKIDSFTATEVELNGKKFPIGRSYKELVQSVLGTAAE